MNLRKNTKWTISAVCLTVAAVITMNTANGTTKNPKNERRIKIVAQRFSYTPSEIVLKTGESVRLEFTSLDFVHGFNIPDLNLRANLPPGRVTTIHLTPQKAGVYDFLCDNFCGTGHENMNGKIIVKD